MRKEFDRIAREYFGKSVDLDKLFQTFKTSQNWDRLHPVEDKSKERKSNETVGFFESLFDSVKYNPKPSKKFYELKNPVNQDNTEGYIAFLKRMLSLSKDENYKHLNFI